MVLVRDRHEAGHQAQEDPMSTATVTHTGTTTARSLWTAGARVALVAGVIPVVARRLSD